MKNKYIKMVSIIILTFYILIVNNKECNAQQLTYFEDIGRYSVAVAGNNNAYRGTSISNGVYLIKDYPQNWDNIKNNIPSDILARINNISGSYLDFDGELKRTWLTTMLHIDDGTALKKDILVIKPDGSYFIVYGKSKQTVEIDIKDSGWYYVSILDCPVCPQASWAITSIYENKSFSMKYMKLEYANLTTSLIGGTDHSTLEVYYNTKFKLKDQFEVFGLIIAAGIGGFSQEGQTEDTMEAILSDGTYQFLYEQTYNGKTVFEGRSVTDFANGTYNAIRSHNIPGGELDVFAEKFGKDFFGNKDLVGYRFTKIGVNGYLPQLIGLAQEIYSPIMEIDTSIVDNGDGKLVKGEKIHTTVNVTNTATDSENNIGYNSTITSKVDGRLSNVSNIVVKCNGTNYNKFASYDSQNNIVVLNGISTINPGDVFTIEYDAIINDNMGDIINTDITIPTEATIKTFPIDITSSSLTDEEKVKYENLFIEEKDDDSITGIYKFVAGNVIVNHIDKFDNSIILSTNTLTGYVGDEYIAESAIFEGYDYEKAAPDKIEGNMAENSTTINFYYLKKSNILVKYIDENTGKEIPGVNEIITTYKEKDVYTTDKKEIEGYTYTRDTQNTSGIVGREDIEVVYYYKKNSGVTVRYLDKYATDIEVLDSESITGLEGADYTTTKKTVLGYVYDSVDGQANGKLQSTATTVTYYYIKESNVVVKYIDENTGNEIPGVNEITTTYKEKDVYTTDKKEIEGYTYTRDTQNTSGIVGREDIEVVYYYKKNSGVTVRYLDKYATDIEVSDSESITGLEGADYTTTKKTVLGYVYDSVDGQANGKLQSTATTVTYYYIKESNVVVKYIDENTGNEIPGVNEIITTYKEKDAYTTDKKEIEGYTYTRDTKNTSGTVGRGDIEVVYYYKKNTSVTVKYVDMLDNNKEISQEDFKAGLQGDTYTTEQRNIDGYIFVESVGQTNGNMEANPITVIYKYKKAANLIVEHIDVNTNSKIVDDVIKVYKEGDTYEALPQSIPGYVVVQEPDEKTGIMGREDIIKTFYYKKISGGLVVKYVDKITNELLDSNVYNGNENDVINLETKSFMYYVLESKPDMNEVKLTVEPIELIYYYVKATQIDIVGIDEATGEELYQSKISGLEGEKYIAIAKNLEGYEIVGKDNIEGVFDRNNNRIEFIYRKINTKESTVKLKYVDKETDEVLKEDLIRGKVGDKYTTEQLDFKNYDFVEMVGKNEGEITEEVQEVIYYYIKKTGKLVVIYEDENGKELKREEEEGKVGEIYEVEINEIDGYEIVQIPENTKGEYIDGIINIVVKLKKIEVKGAIVIRYFDNEGNVIKEEMVQIGTPDDEFYIELPEIEGYRIIGDKYVKGQFIDGKLVYNVIYEKIKDVETGDINILLHSVIFILCLSFIFNKKINEKL